jgi:hypothetical protein
LYRRLRRRGKEPQLTHEEILEIINDIWEIESVGKVYPLYVKGLDSEDDEVNT